MISDVFVSGFSLVMAQGQAVLCHSRCIEFQLEKITPLLILNLKIIAFSLSFTYYHYTCT
jgi:hypothetical protein